MPLTLHVIQRIDKINSTNEKNEWNQPISTTKRGEKKIHSLCRGFSYLLLIGDIGDHTLATVELYFKLKWRKINVATVATRSSGNTLVIGIFYALTF